MEKLYNTLHVYFNLYRSKQQQFYKLLTYYIWLFFHTLFKAWTMSVPESC